MIWEETGSKFELERMFLIDLYCYRQGRSSHITRSAIARAEISGTSLTISLKFDRGYNKSYRLQSFLDEFDAFPDHTNFFFANGPVRVLK